MTKADLTTPEQKSIIRQALQSARQMKDIVSELIASGMPYNEHLEKAIEQVDVLERFTKALDIE